MVTKEPAAGRELVKSGHHLGEVTVETIKATEDLVVEVWPDWGAAGDTPLVKVRSLSLERDGEASPGMVVVFADELEHLVAALAEAREALAEAGNVVTDTPASMTTATPLLSPPEEER